MYQCPGCGGNLKFNVERQKLFCENCLFEADPYTMKNLNAAEEEQIADDEYEVTVFRCPQCGAEILSEDTTAATFCSFCGTTTVLESRVSKGKKPAYILPFKQTKEDCKNAYAKMMKRAFFAPDEFKDPKFIEKFRGIYMPYWDYQYKSDMPYKFRGGKSHRKGDYVYTDVYDLNCDVKMNYKGVFFDASSTFADHLSECIAPFEVSDAKEFTPAYLSGFYADTNDVGENVYSQIANCLIRDDLKRTGKQNSELSPYDISDFQWKKFPVANFQTSKLVMLPVWFLSYRNGDRVSYAVVNGQTGKVAADLPVDMKKYLKASLILSLILFVVLNLFFTLTPGKLLIIAVALAVGCLVAINMQMTDLIERDLGLDDIGKISMQRKNAKVYSENQKKFKGFGSPFGISMIFITIALFLSPLFQFLPIAVFILFITAPKTGRLNGLRKKDYFSNMGKKFPVLLKPILGILAIIIMLVMHPVFDGWYYLSSFFSLLMTGLSMLDLMKYHNKLASRKLPQFNKRGGDENE